MVVVVVVVGCFISRTSAKRLAFAFAFNSVSKPSASSERAMTALSCFSWRSVHGDGPAAIELSAGAAVVAVVNE